jgi:thiol-disulfide isomerase/thioredoxin
MRKSRFLLGGLALWMAALVHTPSTHAAQLGDPAAPLKIAEWIKGRPVDLAKGRGKKVYVVEFWATWCPPCRRSIPHLTQLQKKFGPRGVVFIGISTEKPAVVKAFVKKMGDQMNYTVAVDQDRQTSRAYMTAYHQNGIPTAFVINKEGKVIWVGHPMSNLEQTLEEVLAGRYDIEKSALRAEGMKLLRQFAQKSQQPDVDEASLRKLADQIEEVDQKAGGLQPGARLTARMLMDQALAGRLLRRYQKAIFNGKSDAELAALEEELRAKLPVTMDLDQLKRRLKHQKLVNDYLTAATNNQADQARALAAAILTELKDDANALNQIAWTILTNQHVKYRDLAFALQAAKAAVDASREQDASILDTYARALWDNNRHQEAITWQKKAVSQASNDTLRKMLRKTLDQYQNPARQ